MEDQIKIGVLSGSLSQSSLNTALARFVARDLADSASGGGGIETAEIDLLSLDLPMFSPAIEELPQGVVELKDRMIWCDALIVTSPEYNGSMTGALKNAIDWASIPRQGDEPLACFKGKVCGLLSASPGAMGGLQGLVHVRQILTRLQMHVIPAEYALGNAHEAFDDQGNIKDEKVAGMAMGVGHEMVRVCRAFKG